MGTYQDSVHSSIDSLATSAQLNVSKYYLQLLAAACVLVCCNKE
uniref:Uncharacterized protein n=1 Tax=Arundo donax TaxID=35708 RepID=A0A0A9CCK5_ARUDO